MVSSSKTQRSMIHPPCKNTFDVPKQYQDKPMMQRDVRTSHKGTSHSRVVKTRHLHEARLEPDEMEVCIYGWF